MPKPKKWEGKLEELHLVNAEVDRELSSFVHRDSSMQSRATMLVGAASVVGAIQIGDGMGALNILNLLLSFSAAVSGVLVIFPRGGEAPNPRRMHNAVLEGTPSEEALHLMIEAKLDTLDEDEASLIKRGRYAKIGLALLAASILIAAINAFVPAPSAEPATSPDITVVTFE